MELRTLERDFEHGDALREFDYDAVGLSPGPHRDQLEHTLGVVAALDLDSLMRPFRVAAGMPAPGNDLDGWYRPGGGIPGGNFPLWLSALSRYAAITGDAGVRATVHRWLTAFAETVEPTGEFYRGRGWRTWVYDKMVCGLLDAYLFAGQEQAPEILSKVTDAALPHLPDRVMDFSEDEINRTYTMAEQLFRAWQVTGSRRYLELAGRYLHDTMFEQLADGRNVLPGRHAYSHILALSSAVKAYLVMGHEKYLKAAVNALAFIEEQSYATGACGPLETFIPLTVPPAIRERLYPPLDRIESLADSLLLPDYHTETVCNALGHFKVARQLLRITRDPRYGDGMERVMVNTALGVRPLTPLGRAFYYSNYHPHARKAYYDGLDGRFADGWPCDAGTLGQLAADYGISSYLLDPEGVFVNLYVPSTARWSQAGTEVTLTQSGDYPLGSTIRIEVSVTTPATFAIRLRIPAWTRAPSILVNGDPAIEPVEPGTFADIRREWRAGDLIALDLPCDLELKPVDPEHPDLVALVSGPLVLFAIGECGSPRPTRAELLGATRRGDLAEWVAETRGGPIRFMPWAEIRREPYSTYLEVTE